MDELYPKTLFRLIFDKLHIELSQKSLSAFYDKLIFIKENKFFLYNDYDFPIDDEILEEIESTGISELIEF